MCRRVGVQVVVRQQVQGVRDAFHRNLPQGRVLGGWSASLQPPKELDELRDVLHPETIAATILPCPIDRVVSHYYFVKRTKRHDLRERLLSSNASLEDCAGGDFAGETANYYTRRFSGSSIEQLKENPEEALQWAFDVVIEFDIVGFQHDLPAVAEELSRAAGFCWPFGDKVANRPPPTSEGCGNIGKGQDGDCRSECRRPATFRTAQGVEKEGANPWPLQQGCGNAAFRHSPRKLPDSTASPASSPGTLVTCRRRIGGCCPMRSRIF